MMPSTELVKDHAGRILADLPISNDDRADLWEAYHTASDADSLARVLARVPSHIAGPLVEAKRLTTPTGLAIHPDHDRAMAPVLKAIEHMATVEKSTLDLAEAHPNFLRHLIQTEVA